MEKLAPHISVEIDAHGVAWEVTVVLAGHTNVYDQHDRTTKQQLPPEIANYRCRVCNHDEFEPVFRHERGDQHPLEKYRPGCGDQLESHIRITEYYCPNCSVKFGDPVKFSVNQPADVIGPKPSEPSMSASLRRLTEVARDLGISQGEP